MKKLKILKPAVEKIFSRTCELKTGQIWYVDKEANELIKKGVAEEVSEGKAVNELLFNNKTITPEYSPNKVVASDETKDKKETEKEISEPLKRGPGRPKIER